MRRGLCWPTLSEERAIFLREIAGKGTNSGEKLVNGAAQRSIGSVKRSSGEKKGDLVSKSGVTMGETPIRKQLFQQRKRGRAFAHVWEEEIYFLKRQGLPQRSKKEDQRPWKISLSSSNVCGKGRPLQLFLGKTRKELPTY